jgi:hypothetical protein
MGARTTRVSAVVNNGVKVRAVRVCLNEEAV